MRRSPLSGAGTVFRTSSSRAAAQPKLRYRGVRCPIMLSRVFAILYAKSPGRPKNKYQKTGATTPSLKFSARLSIAARATPWISRLIGSRPTMCHRLTAACQSTSVEGSRDCGDVVEQAALRDQHRDDHDLNHCPEEAAAAEPLNHQPQQCSAANQDNDCDDAAFAA